MKSAFHSFPWYPENWRRSETRMRLSPIARGLFRELIDYQMSEGSLPAEAPMLAKIADCPPTEFAEIWPDLEASFPISSDGRRRNPQAVDTYNKLKDFRAQMKAAGARGAAMRHGKPISQAKATPSPSHAQAEATLCSTSTSTSTSTSVASPSAKPARTRAPTPPFTPPTPDEVSRYAAEIDFPVNAELFTAYYESRDWKRGREPMKNWKATLRLWKQRQANGATTTAPTHSEADELPDVEAIVRGRA